MGHCNAAVARTKLTEKNSKKVRAIEWLLVRAIEGLRADVPI